MSKIAFLVGDNFKIGRGYKQSIVKTMYGNVLLYNKDKVIFISRNGKNKNIPPHKVNDRANICALNLLGVEKIIGLDVVRSLKENFKHGSVVIPDDLVNFNPDSFFEFEYKSVDPEFDVVLRKKVASICKKLKITTKQKATYVYTNGPRLETASEAKIYKKWGDLLGMSGRNESCLARELGIPYAAVCFIGDYAKGIAKKKLSSKVVDNTAKKTNKNMENMVKAIIKAKW